MKKKLLCVLILVVCFALVGCESSRDEEIERIGNLINGTES